MKGIYNLIDKFDIRSALELCRTKHPAHYPDILFELGLFEELLSYLHDNNIENKYNRGG